MVLKQLNIFELIKNYMYSTFVEYIRIANHEIKIYIHKFFWIRKALNKMWDINIFFLSTSSLWEFVHKFVDWSSALIYPTESTTSWLIEEYVGSEFSLCLLKIKQKLFTQSLYDLECFLNPADSSTNMRKFASLETYVLITWKMA